MKLDRKKIIGYLNNHMGDEITTCQMMADCFGEDYCSKVDYFEWFDIHSKICKLADGEGIMLDMSKYSDNVIGLPYNTPFVIRKKRVKKQRGNKYDAPFMNMDRETAEKIANQNSPAERRMIINGDDYYNRIVHEIAEEEVNAMSEEDKKYYLDHPDYNEHHFGYGMYLRNNYIHGKMNVLSPDDMSGDIFDEIIKLLKG